MAPENEGKPPPALSASVVEVRYEDIHEMQTALANMRAKVQDVMSKLSIVEVECKSEAEGLVVPGRRAEEVRGFVKELELATNYGHLVQVKLGNLVPRIKGSDGPGDSDALKRSRLMSHTLPRMPSLVDSKLNILGGDGADGVARVPNTGYEASQLAPGDKLPLKFIRTENNTKAAYQKPQIYMPTAKLGVPMLDSPADGETASLSSGENVAKSPTSAKKRPSRSKRDRNRAKNKVASNPEPVMQRLMPGDTNKIPEDGYLWRKYGNKPIKTASYKRGYYKCRHFKEVRCNATKIVQQTNNDPSTFSVCYKGEHTCQQGKLASRILNGDSDATLADQVQNNGSNGGSISVIDGDDTSLLDQMEWPHDDDDASDASDMEFPADDGMDEADDSMTMLTSSEGELPVASQPASPPLLDFAALENMPVLDMPEPASASIAVQDAAVAPWAEPLVETISVPAVDTFAEGKYESIETCPPLDQQTGKGLMSLNNPDDNEYNYLLEVIQGGFQGGSLMDGDFNDIHNWSFDEGFMADAF